MGENFLLNCAKKTGAKEPYIIIVIIMIYHHYHRHHHCHHHQQYYRLPHVHPRDPLLSFLNYRRTVWDGKPPQRLKCTTIKSNRIWQNMIKKKNINTMIKHNKLDHNLLESRTTANCNDGVVRSSLQSMFLYSFCIKIFFMSKTRTTHYCNRNVNLKFPFKILHVMEKS